MKSLNSIFMTKILVFLLLNLLPVFSYCQETKKITDKETKEVYYVLKSNKKIKQGSYQKFSYDDKLVINGTYSNNEKSGVWEFYDHNGKLQQKYDFSKNKLVYNEIKEKDKDKKYKVINGTDTIETLLENPPVYIGGDRIMLPIIINNVKYPVKALEYGISGTVFISFIIDKNGNTSNHRIKEGLGYDLDEEALRVIKLLPDSWVPGYYKQQVADIEYTIPIKFQLK